MTTSPLDSVHHGRLSVIVLASAQPGKSQKTRAMGPTPQPLRELSDLSALQSTTTLASQTLLTQPIHAAAKLLERPLNIPQTRLLPPSRFSVLLGRAREEREVGSKKVGERVERCGVGVREGRGTGQQLESREMEEMRWEGRRRWERLLGFGLGLGRRCHRQPRRQETRAADSGRCDALRTKKAEPILIRLHLRRIPRRRVPRPDCRSRTGDRKWIVYRYGDFAAVSKRNRK